MKLTTSSHPARRLLALCTALLALGITALQAVPLDFNGVGLNSNEQAIANSMANTSGQHRAFIRLDPTLTAVAHSRAQDMANRGYFDHVNPDGYGPNALVKAAGYPLPEWWGDDRAANYIESIAAGFTSPGDCWSAWMKSDPHRTHLLAEDNFYADQTSVGIAVVTASGSQYGTYWVVITAPPRPAAPLKITAPSSNFNVTTSEITATGTASDESGAAKVEYAVENANGTSGYTAATGVAKWQARISLQPGPNTIHARSRDTNGTIITAVDRKVNYVVMSDLTVTSTAGGSISGNFSGTTSRAIGQDYTVKAQPQSGYIFAGWTGSITSDGATLDFTMADGLSLQANFIPNPFAETAAGYQSLVQTDSGAGLLKITSFRNGTFTGKLLLNGERLRFHGHLQADGTAAIAIPKSHGIVLNLQMDVSGQSQAFTARLADQSLNLTLSLDRNAYSSKNNPAPIAGEYHVVFNPKVAQTNTLSQDVSGQAQVTVNKAGTAFISGRLSDGTAFSTTSFVTVEGHLAVYAKLHGDTGSLSGELQFSNGQSGDIVGSLTWSQAQTKKFTSFSRALIADGSAQ